MTHTQRATSVLGAALCVVAFAAEARAHAGVPRAFEIFAEPGNPRALTVRSDGWGFFRSEDGGKTFEWSCAEVYGGKTTASTYANFAVLRGGRLLVSNTFDGVKYTDDHCGWQSSAGLEDENVAFVADAGAHVVAVSATYRDGALHDTLFRSDDRGGSFTKTEAVFPPDVVPQALVVAPSDANRVYVSGLTFNVGDGFFLRSLDAGLSYERFAVPINGRLAVRIAAVHPTRPDVVLVRIDRPEGLGQTIPDEMLLSTNGGETWSTLVSSQGDLPGATFSPDGTKLFIGGPVEGLLTAEVDALTADPAKAASALTRVSDLPHWGLLATESGLYGGTDQFPPKTGPTPPFSLGFSLDDGRTFEQVMRTCDVTFSRCDAASLTGRACESSWNDETLGGFNQDFIQNLAQCQATPAGPDAGDEDAGTPAPTPRPSDDGCAVSGGNVTAGNTVGALASLVAVAAAVVGRRLRRR